MDLIEAIKSRKSIRFFKTEPVLEKTIEEVLDVARWSPSGVNKQSWEFVVLTGEALAAVKAANVAQYEGGVPKHPFMPQLPLTGPYRRRQVETAKKLYALAGVQRDDIEGRREWFKRDLRFFDAPAAVLVCFDETAPEARATFEAGIVTQSIVLAATAFGLGTCIMVAPVEYPDTLARVARIPESKRIVTGIAIGYPDEGHPVNSLRTTRDPVSEITMWRNSLEKGQTPDS
ncbi:MAG: nitroreductase [Chloroflexi bacterium]|nr:nitroreductase [Chloroflexota bacterium]